MRLRQITVALVVTAVGVVGGLAGCSSGGTDRRPPGPTGSVSPTGLATSLRAFTTGSYRFKVVANEGSYTGAIDPVADQLDATVSVSSEGATLKIDTLGVRGTAYTRLNGLPMPGFDGATWFRIDPARVTRPGALGLSAIEDPTGVQALVAAARDVRRSGQTYTGTVDLTKVTAWGPVNIAQVIQLGQVARAVPFEATVDGQDRLLSMQVDIPASGAVAANSVRATYSDFGAPVTVTAPAAAEPLPDHLYGLLGL